MRSGRSQKMNFGESFLGGRSVSCRGSTVDNEIHFLVTSLVQKSSFHSCRRLILHNFTAEVHAQDAGPRSKTICLYILLYAVCTYICTHLYMYVYIYIHIYIYIYTYICSDLWVCSNMDFR